MSVRAKFVCSSIEMFKTAPHETTQSTVSGEKIVRQTWPRKYRFTPQYDTTIPEDQRFAQYTPSGELWISVDNPDVVFEPGKAYYLDFTEVPSPKPSTES
jgi:hypothetical protein